MTRRALIVNADDFGQSDGINRGIAECHDRGIVTSASLMVCWNAAQDAVAYAAAHPGLSVGLHVDLSESVCANGEWRCLYQRADCRDATAVEREIRTQLDRFRDLLGRNPTHIDSHQHVHRDEPARSIVIALASALGIPARHYTHGVQYIGGFYGQTSKGEHLPDGVGVARLVELIRAAPGGISELACHPGYPAALDTMYRTEREIEIRSLCSPEAKQALDEEQIELMSFAEVVT